MKIASCICACLCGLLFSSCIVVVDGEIPTDAKVDPRLEGVWRITPKTKKEARKYGADDVGVNGYAIFGKAAEDRYRFVMIDRFKDKDEVASELDVRTIRTDDWSFLVVSYLEDIEADPDDPIDKSHSMIIPYQFDKDGNLFGELLFGDDFDRANRAHPIKHSIEEKPFAPTVIEAEWDAVRKFYEDKRVQKKWGSVGKYRRLK